MIGLPSSHTRWLLHSRLYWDRKIKGTIIMDVTTKLPSPRSASCSNMIWNIIISSSVVFAMVRLAIIVQNLWLKPMLICSICEDHIVHALLTVLGLGVSVEELDEIYDRERSYQKPRYPVDEDVVTAMADPEKFKEYLDQQPPYSNFLLFFQREIETKGVKQTLEEHVFADSDHARRLLIRLFTSKSITLVPVQCNTKDELHCRHLAWLSPLGIRP